jgi:AcrR family transcriptional regulator
MRKTKDSYHHGDLRAALLAAGEAVLTETGVEGFSLRLVAKRVGVSHSAPAHHFGDAQGLLTALAAEGFRRFLLAMQARQQGAAFRHLVEDIARLRGVSPFDNAAAMADVMASWSMVHGFAELLISNRMKTVSRLPKAEREAYFESVFCRTVA